MQLLMLLLLLLYAANYEDCDLHVWHCWWT